MGPLGSRIEPYGPTGLDEARAFFREQAEALRDGGVDLFVLETMSNIAEIEQGIMAIRDVCSLPIIAQMTFDEDGHTLAGQSAAHVVKTLAALDIPIIGANCGMGPAGTLDVVTAMAEAIQHLPPEVTRPALAAQPNAGLPARVDGRFLYVTNRGNGTITVISFATRKIVTTWRILRQVFF